MAIADPRRTDEASQRFARELELIADAGRTVGVLPLASHLRGAHPHAEPMRRLFARAGVRLLRLDTPVAARLLLTRDLEVFRQVQEVAPNVIADHAVAITDVDALIGEASDGTPLTEAAAATALEAATRLFPTTWSMRPRGGAQGIAEISALPGVSLGEEWPDVDRDPVAWTHTIDELLPAAAGAATAAVAEVRGGTRSVEKASESGPAPWLIRRAGEKAPAARVALVSDNGHGLGHVTRLMAIARRLPARVAPVFFTLSESFPLIQRSGFPVEYFPSRHRFGIQLERWEALLSIRFRSFLSQFRPSAVVIDHGDPPRAVTEAAREAGVALAWSRRGLWREGSHHDPLDREALFDLIIEPGDLAAPLDRGATRRSRSAQRVHPITLIDRDDLLPRDRARADLGLPPDRPTLLLQLAADDTAALAELRRSASRWLRSAGVTVFTPRHPLHPALDDRADQPATTSIYPMARYLNAFDCAVSMAGYNSFHELILAAVPTVFIARDTDTVDDQQARARYAELAGVGLRAGDVDDGLVDRVATLLDPFNAARFQAAAGCLHPGNGAAHAADLIHHVLGGTRP